MKEQHQLDLLCSCLMPIAWSSSWTTIFMVTQPFCSSPTSCLPAPGLAAGWREEGEDLLTCRG